MENWQIELEAALREHVATSALNRFAGIDGTPIWGAPLVGFAGGDDPLFERYHDVVGPFHLTPRAALTQALGHAERSGVTVVAWVLPATRATRLSNRAMTVGPSQRWNHARFRGEEFNDDLRRHVVAWLAGRGLDAVAPVLSPGFSRPRGPLGLASSWSERHIAYAAGLGTFGLSDGLITAAGVAMRCGSVVVAAAGAATPRPYDERREYCLYVRDGSCGTCMERCPAGAITPEGHDKDRCYAYIHEVLAEWPRRPGYMGTYGACGLCQTGVPCEARIPADAAK